MSRPPLSVPEPSPGTKFGALHHRDYRRYFLLVLLSATADNIEHVISYWVIFQAFHSPTLAGFAVISHWVPFLLFSVYAGALADRFDCRKLIQISQGLFALASLSWAVLFLTGALRIWHAAVILLIHGGAGVIGVAASQLIIHDIVGPERLPSAIRLNATSRYLAILLGPAVGGGMMLLLGPGMGLLVNILLYAPFTLFLLRIPYTGHLRDPDRRRAPRFGLADIPRLLAEARADARIIMMIVLGGTTSFLVGNAFQAQMPEYAHHLGTDEAGTWYSVLLAANAVGAIIGAVLLESASFIRLSARTAIGCAAVWGVLMALFPAAQSYPAAVTILVLAGAFNIAFTSMAQTLIQLLAPPNIRGSMVGLFNTSMLGLRAGSGLTVGVLGAVIGVQWSLALSASAVVLVALGLLVVDRRAHPRRGLSV
ncbi:MAG: MFS transporter [Candidatus Rokuibacteriota bacterium]|nr:MAG: MFS transporter [Candidatus Rokubacteria bacterium]